MATGLDPAALRLARKRAGLTQAELAAAMGANARYQISVWERGEQEPRTPRQLVALAVALAVEPEDLLMKTHGALDFRGLRVRGGLSAGEVAEAAGVSVRSVHRWEAGQFGGVPAVGTIRRLARVLDVSPDDVVRALGATQGLFPRSQ